MRDAETRVKLDKQLIRKGFHIFPDFHHQGKRGTERAEIRIVGNFDQDEPRALCATWRVLDHLNRQFLRRMISHFAKNSAAAIAHITFCFVYVRIVGSQPGIFGPSCAGAGLTI